MNKDEKEKALIDETTAGFDMVFLHARAIAMLPIEDWLEAIRRSEDILPFTDPTLYRRYIYSKKPIILKKMLEAALVVKHAMEEIQPLALEELAREEEEKAKHATKHS